MKEFKCTMTLSIICEADNIEDAADLFGDAGVSVTNGDDGSELDVEITNWKVEEITL